MHATIQKPIEDIISFLKPGEKVFVVGCDNCAAKCHSGGIPETERMAERLKKRGVDVVGWSVPGPAGVSLCKLANTKKVFDEQHAAEIEKADSFLVLACGQGLHTVIDATGGGFVHPGCDTIFGGETVSEGVILEYCQLCGECITEFTGGLCPLTLCSKALINGPCGGAKDGKCEVDREQDCGWHLIYERLKAAGKLELMDQYQEPKNFARWSRPRKLNVAPTEATFKSLAGAVTVRNDD
ncbi:MAG: methylenetetrahydrofolate reductase C-terminal domain-containing protein [Deltaproteobacteria bacterium]|nr:methylenetetrahydrofolate reductase C-terminal domain-containing protein [Deltaproteobacteria bacterium]